MKILVLSSGNPLITKNGRGIFEFDQAKALKEIGEDVKFLSIDLRSIRRKRKFGKTVFTIDGIECVNISFPLGKLPLKMHNFLGYKQFKRGLKTILNTGWKPDIIHCHFGLQTGYFAYKSKNDFGIPYIITEHDSYIHNGLINNKQKTLLQKIYNFANGRIAVSKKYAHFLKNTFNLTFNYVPNIIDTNAFNFVPTHEDKKTFLFTSVGSLFDGKGFDVLLKAFKNIKEKNDNIQLQIIGSGPNFDELRLLAKQLNIQQCVNFLGHLDRKQVNEYLNKSNCFVLASKSETFGVSYIEAMYLGLPIIATKCGGPESFVNEDNGLLVDVDSVEQLASAMEYMIVNYKKYNGESIHKFVVDNFSPSVIAKQIVNYIKENV